MSKKIYIFGDSYAQLNPLVDYSWPCRLDYEYDVENFAHEGTSVDYSLQKLYELVSGNYNKDGIVLFFMTDILRQNWSFFKQNHQFLASCIFDKKFYKNHKVMRSDIDLYKKYADFAKTFFIENPHPWENIAIEKNYAYINAHSHLFNKILIWPCFDKFDNKFTFNQNVKIIEKPLVEMGGDEPQTNSFDTRINHLKPVKHKKVYNRLVEWIEDV